jgi:hypothetical protein
MHEQVEKCKFKLTLTKTENNPHAKFQVQSFTVMLIIISVKLVGSNSSTQGKITQHNTAFFLVKGNNSKN